MTMVGLRVGPFEIVREASLPGDPQWVAARVGTTRRQPAEALVRVLAPDAPPADRKALQHEFDVLRSMDDPHVPAPIAIYEGMGALAISAIDGVSLERLIELRSMGRVQMTPATLLDIGIELADALQHVHLKGWVHGDLLPDRILMGPEGRLWLWRLGAPSRTTICTFSPPERARGEGVSATADQWALAAILAALITGHPPWRGDDLASEARRGDPARAVGPIEGQWPALGRLLRRMLDPQPDNRFPGMAPVRQELLALARKAGGASERAKLGAALSRLAEDAEAPTEDREPPPRADRLAARSEPPPTPRLRAPTNPTWSPDDGVPAMAPPTPAPPPGRVVAEGTPAPAQLRAEEPTPRPVSRGARPLPDEAMPVVRVDSLDEVPTARIGSDKGAKPRLAAPKLATPDLADTDVKLAVPAGAVSQQIDQENTGSEEQTSVFSASSIDAAELAAMAVTPPPAATRVVRRGTEGDEESTGSEELTTFVNAQALEAVRIQAPRLGPAIAPPQLRDPMDPPTVPTALRRKVTGPPPEQALEHDGDSTVVFDQASIEAAANAALVETADRPTAVPVDTSSDPGSGADLGGELKSDPGTGPIQVIPNDPLTDSGGAPAAADDSMVKMVAPVLAIVMLVALALLFVWQLAT